MIFEKLIKVKVKVIINFVPWVHYLLCLKCCSALSDEHFVNSFLVKDDDPITIDPETWIQSYATCVDLIVVTATACIMSCFNPS